MDLIAKLEQEEIARLGKSIPEFAPGDTVVVSVNVVEGERTRVQAFEGVCISRRGGGVSETFTVRKVSAGVGVESADTTEYAQRGPRLSSAGRFGCFRRICSRLLFRFTAGW